MKNITSNNCGNHCKLIKVPVAKNNKDYPRGYVRDYLREAGLPYGKVDEICKIIPNGYIGKDFPK